MLPSQGIFRTLSSSCAADRALALSAEFFLQFFLAIPARLRCDQTGGPPPQVALFCDREGRTLLPRVAVPWRLRDRTTLSRSCRVVGSVDLSTVRVGSSWFLA